jgi:tRNA A37 threonylcarbamoyladenosine modification protein TsaB
MLLAIDTATQMAGLALYDPVHGQFLAEETWNAANNHTVELMPRLVRMMEQQQVWPLRP